VVTDDVIDIKWTTVTGVSNRVAQVWSHRSWNVTGKR